MRFRNTLLVLLFGGTLSMALLREQPRGTLEPFDRAHREFLKANPGTDAAPVPEHPAIVFGRLDDGDLERPVFASWPLNESDWQIILQNLPGYEPKVTAIAMKLTFPKAAGDLEKAAQNLPGLCVSPLLSVSPGDGSQSLPPSLPVLKTTGSIEAIPEFKSLRDAPLPGAAAADEIDMLPTGGGITLDGDWCRVPMLARMGDKVVPTLVLRALLTWSGASLEEVTVQPGAAITAGKSLRIEIDEAGCFRFYLSLAPPVPSVNADAFVLTKEQSMAHLRDDDPQRPLLAGLKGSLLWLGLDDASSRSLKLPNGSPVSRAELTARAIAAIQTRSHLLPLAPQFQWITPAATLFFCVWLTHWRKSRLWPGALVAIIGLIGVSLWLYRRDHLWLPLGPSLALVLATLLLSYLLPAPKRKGASDAGTRKTVRSTLPRAQSRTRTPELSSEKPATARDARVVAAYTQDLPPQETEPPPVTTAAESETFPVAANDEDEATEEAATPTQIARPQRRKGKKKRRK